MALPSSLARPVLRSRLALRFAPRRLESSAAAAKVSEAAKDTAAKAKEYQAMAQQGLSRVTTAAGPALVGAARGVTSALGRVGGRTGRLVAFVERMLPPSLAFALDGSSRLTSPFQGKPPLSSTTPRSASKLARSCSTARR